MHETVIAENIINEANKQGSVYSIKLEIGELAHVPPNELLECLNKLVNWKIVRKIMPAKADCSCGFKGHPTVLDRGHDYFMIECPECRKTPKLISGTEIKIISVKVK